MDAVDILKVCIRRWYVMLPILLGAAGVSYQLVQAQETSYTAAVSYGLVQPSLDPGDNASANPMGSAADILVGEALEAQLNSGETQEELGGGATRGWGPGEAVNNRYYSVRIPQFETTYEVRAWGEDEAEVRAVVDRVVEAAPDITNELQIRASVPPQLRWEPFVLASPQVAELPSTGWIKLVLAVMGVAILMGAAWSVVVDRVLRGRRAQRESRAGDDGPDDGRDDRRQLTSGDAAPARTPSQSPDRGLTSTRTYDRAPVRAPDRGPLQASGTSTVKTSATSTGPAGRKPAGRR